MKKLIQIILAVVIVGLVYIIYDQISTPIRFEQELKDNLIESLGSARTIVNSTFNTENLATDTQGGEQNAADTAAD